MSIEERAWNSQRIERAEPLRKRFPTRVWKPENGGTGSLGNIQVAYGRNWMMELDAATIEASD